MLIFPMKKKWYEKIKNGEKTTAGVYKKIYDCHCGVSDEPFCGRPRFVISAI